MNLTPRSKITVRWTTNPADFGYDGKPTDWLDAPGEVMGISRAASFEAELRQRIGHGTYFAVQYRNGDRVVSLDDIIQVMIDMDYRRTQK